MILSDIEMIVCGIILLLYYCGNNCLFKIEIAHAIRLGFKMIE